MPYLSKSSIKRFVGSVSELFVVAVVLHFVTVRSLCVVSMDSVCFYLWRGAIDQSVVGYKTVEARSPWEL